MSTENNAQDEVILDLVDLINAARIMESAVARNAFQVDELVNVAPIVSKFVKFADKALADIKEREEAAAQAQDTAGTEGEE
ncbi:hypothetical protein FOI42_RS04220 [Escherichia coli]|nr:hypothetical protein [Escherichia coli]EFL4883664.1 hypothetical protein [Escherichia coli]MED6699521.1 hypothetical protein [Escherichia coli O157]USL83638.1 hypothetical protein A4_562 [Escherichia phage A4]HCQ0858473.1 hypothetical protein [Escherichia coli]